MDKTAYTCNAQYTRGMAYYEAEDFASAVEWFRLAEEQGMEKAREALKRLGYAQSV